MNPELLGRNPGTRALAIRVSRSERGGPPETIGIERRVATGCLAVVQIRGHQTNANDPPPIGATDSVSLYARAQSTAIRGQIARHLFPQRELSRDRARTAVATATTQRVATPGLAVADQVFGPTSV